MNAKKFFGLSLMLLTSSITQASFAPIILPKSSIMLKEVDGLFGLNGDVIAQMYNVLRGILEIEHGKPTPTRNGKKKRVGLFQVDGMHYSLHELATLEKEIETQLQTVATGSKEYNRIMSKKAHVKKAFEEARTLFLEATFQFLEPIQAMKSFNLKLLNEWAEQRNRQNSLLLEWNTSNGKEKEMFDARIVTCDALIEFCNDLEDFLRILMHNAPRAYKQFKDWYVKK